MKEQKTVKWSHNFLPQRIVILDQFFFFFAHFVSNTNISVHASIMLGFIEVNFKNKLSVLRHFSTHVTIMFGISTAYSTPRNFLAVLSAAFQLVELFLNR